MRPSTIKNKIIFFDGHNSHFDDSLITCMECRYIQPFNLKSGESGNNQPNDIELNVKNKSRCNDAKASCMVKYGTPKSYPII